MQKRVEFACSQEQLFETVMNLAKQGQWPQGWWNGDLGQPNSLGFIDLEISRERVLKNREIPGLTARKADLQYFGKTGKIVFAGIDEHNSALVVRSEKRLLLKFFDDLVTLVSAYRPLKAVGVEPAAAQPRATKAELHGSPHVPTYPKRLPDWKAAWQRIKGERKRGSSYKELATAARLSPETVADIVKAGDAGLLD